MDKLKEELSHPDSSIEIAYSPSAEQFFARLHIYVRGMSTYIQGSGESPEAALAELLENYEPR